MPGCDYLVWSKERHRMEPCGKTEDEFVRNGVSCSVSVQQLKVQGQKSSRLCREHMEFVLDALNDCEIKRHKLEEQQRKTRIREKIKQLQLELKTGEWNDA